MKKWVIRADNLGKSYHITTEYNAHHTLQEQLMAGMMAPLRWLRRLGQKEAFDDERMQQIWALRHLSFEVGRGEVVGIIGHNGAGKSTLLKILAGITEPSEGDAWVRGRVASLLEVGTGFHPELTGRENVFLNGAILGMTNDEIERKFDQIVAFAEFEQFIDTPIKRYSSGMTLRLAFAVAAHLEPEILLIDEVLAVGDAAFQKKCLDKMESVAQEGRTILFVSHDLGAVQDLCPRTVCLSLGGVIADGASSEVIKSYLQSVQEVQANTTLDRWNRRSRRWGQAARLHKCRVLDEKNQATDTLLFGEPLRVLLEVKATAPIKELSVGIRIDSQTGRPIAHAISQYDQQLFEAAPEQPLQLTATMETPKLTPDSYWLTITLFNGKRIVDQLTQVVRFTVLEATYPGQASFNSRARGHLLLPVAWETR